MKPEHVDAVHAIEQKTNSIPWSEHTFRGELANRDAHYFVIRAGGVIVGFAGYWKVIDEAHITTVAVEPDRQGAGLGRKLMECLLDHARDQGMTCATLEVRARNQRAIALYENLGFVACGVRKRYYADTNEDAIVMWLHDLRGGAS
ncbi:MAG: ribosomal-protein-alanine N-acetyltransferase [Armatimonadota bacterium]